MERESRLKELKMAKQIGQSVTNDDINEHINEYEMQKKQQMAELRLKRLQEQRQHLSFNVRYFPKKQAQIEDTPEDEVKSRFLK